MAGSIAFPAQTKFWIAFGLLDILHVGVTQTNQRTDSGQESFAASDTRQDQLDSIVLNAVQTRLPTLPDVGQEVEIGYYVDGLDAVYVKQRHVRISDEVVTDGEMYEVSS